MSESYSLLKIFTDYSQRIDTRTFRIDGIDGKYVASHILSDTMEINVEVTDKRYDIFLRYFANRRDRHHSGEYLVAKAVAGVALASATIDAFLKEHPTGQRGRLFHLKEEKAKLEPERFILKVGSKEPAKTTLFQIDPEVEGDSYMISLGIEDGVQDLVGMEVTASRISFGSWDPDGEWSVDAIYDLTPHVGPQKS